MREMKYVQFLETMDFPKEHQRYYKDVKYRVMEETEDKYVISKRRNIELQKSAEGQQFVTGRI
jgi:hypothetical protein